MPKHTGQDFVFARWKLSFFDKEKDFVEWKIAYYCQEQANKDRAKDFNPT